jgi:hypothetical protein
MAGLTLAQTQAVAGLADVLYDFLPGSGAKYTWQEAAAEHCLVSFWGGGSKRPAITQLLALTLQHKPGSFCGLLVTAVREGIKYRQRKGKPLTREEMARLNRFVGGAGYKIPELNDPAFLGSLPQEQQEAQQSAAPVQSPDPAAALRAARGEAISRLNADFVALLTSTDAQKRGYALERLLTDLFDLEGLAPRGSFRVMGEQIDGSFEWPGNVVFLVEARWRAAQADAADLYVLRGKVDGKSSWTRGLFLSINGFTGPATETFRQGRSANLITMDGEDLMLILEGRWTLTDAIRAKLRHAGETGDISYRLSQAGR